MVTAAMAASSCAKNGDQRMKTSPAVIEVVPGKSIGELRLGTLLSDLPSRGVVKVPGGELDGIKFVLDEHDRIEDIWIDDLRTFPIR